MQSVINLKRLAGVMAVTVIGGGGYGAILTPADAATGPTATLSNGTVTITGTAGRDLIGVTSDASQLLVDFGLDGTVNARFRRSQYNRVQVSGGDGDDGISLTGTGDVPITIHGGLGNDGIGAVGTIGDSGAGDAPTTISGDAGNDGIFAAVPGPITLLGGTGDDNIDGGDAGVGNERVALGDGNDRFTASFNTFVGPRSDVVDGGAGQDTLQMEGTFASEGLALSANAGHLIVDDSLSAHIDADNVENVIYFGFGGLDGGDTVTVNDLSGTDVSQFTPNFSVDLNSTRPDNSQDTLNVRATAGIDHITVAGSASNVTVSGLVPKTVNAVNLEPQDTLRIDTLAGNDTVDRTGLPRGVVQLVVI